MFGVMVILLVSKQIELSGDKKNARKKKQNRIKRNKESILCERKKREKMDFD